VRDRTDRELQNRYSVFERRSEAVRELDFAATRVPTQ
jgi:hypothetical protein